MAEWSKALDLSSSIRKNAQVRTLLKALFGRKGYKTEPTAQVITTNGCSL